MDAGHRHEQHTAVVAVARSHEEAETIRITLQAHGYVAGVAPVDIAFPSLNFVNGIGVSVGEDEAAAARELLRGLSVPTVDDPPAAGETPPA